MKTRTRIAAAPVLTIVLAALAFGGRDTAAQQLSAAGQDRKHAEKSEGRKLSHDETLRWTAENKAWRLARKTRSIWARPIEADEVGREYQTADRAKEKARPGAWLCAGIAGEPWFQTLEKIEGKYEPDGEEARRFDFDTKTRTYRKYKPKATTRNWVAQIKGPGIAGFHIRPGYDPERPLYSPAGGYVVKDEVADPYRDKPKDVWLVQQSLFESTYEIVGDRQPDSRAPTRR